MAVAREPDLCCAGPVLRQKARSTLQPSGLHCDLLHSHQLLSAQVPVYSPCPLLHSAAPAVAATVPDVKKVLPLEAFLPRSSGPVLAVLSQASVPVHSAYCLPKSPLGLSSDQKHS